MKLFFQPVPNEEAMRFLKQLPAVTRAVYDEMAPELRGLAFTLTGMEDARQIQAVRNIIAQLPEGTNFDDVKDQIMAALPWGGAKAERRAELLLRHWGAIAYAQAQYKHDERQKDVFPWRQYITMGDGKVRDTHRALNGIILPVDSPFWKGHLPPWDWMCRCQSVVLMDMDVEEIRQADRHLPPEERRVIEGALLEKLEKSQTLIRGNGRAFDVRTPAEKGESFRGWSPDNILQGVDFTGLTTELDPDLMAKLKTFWESRSVRPGLSVADWVKGKLGSAAKGPLAPVPGLPAIPAGGKAVSAALPAALPPALARAPKLVDAVHGDGSLSPSRVDLIPGSGGGYLPADRSIRIGEDNPDPLGQLFHELAHKLAREAFPGLPVDLGPLLGLARRSAAVRGIEAEIAGLAAAGQPVRAGYADYLKTEAELWARLYAQFITTETRDPALQAMLQRRLGGRTGYLKSSQWSASDFAPLRAEIRRIFTALGWIKPAT